MAADGAPWGRALPWRVPARAVDVEVEALADATWRLTATSHYLSPVVSHLVAGSQGALVVDPGSAVTWPGMLRALAFVREDLDIRWVVGCSPLPTSLGALPLIEATLGSEVMVVTSAELAPMVSHYVTRSPIQILEPPATLDIGGRRLVAENPPDPDGADSLLLRDTRSGMIFGGGVSGGDALHFPGRLESVQSALETVLLTTLAPNALEGRAFAALAPLGRVTSLRTYLKEGDSWFELGGRDGLLGREVIEPPPSGDTTFRVELTDPAPIILDFTLAQESVSLLRDPDVQGLAESLHRPLVSSMRRILSLRKSAQRNWRLREDARRDPLTGVGNRRALKGWASRGRFAALMIDVDRFKTVNDELGHESGDEVLRLVAEAIGSQIRGHDLLIRYGGDEFLLMLDGVDAADGRLLADRIRASVSMLATEGLSPTGKVTVSIGVADGSGQVGDVITRADSALYTAKANGRDTIFVAT